jgi:hypothetical protein
LGRPVERWSMDGWGVARVDGGGGVVWSAGSLLTATISDRSTDFFQVPCPSPLAEFVQFGLCPGALPVSLSGLCPGRTLSRCLARLS